ncbi:DUF6499 domain-containing protein [Mesorhizobium sp.]|uniref:transcriptional regulator domain-containing protein n=1 Tax=Mesorhizobium sp. TaxID=1871066 RepID=UPI0025CF6F1F|nr:DUF6499 domain-containing protein [Mesorhizobium sp.]
MRPDTSRWRDNDSYDYFDTLPIEGLAWECLRRHEPYQRHYQALLTTKTEKAPFPPETQRLWGLRFPGQAGFVRLSARRFLVARRRSSCDFSRAGAGIPVVLAIGAVDRCGCEPRQRGRTPHYP